ncbi:hypothetical protein QCD79_16225 [Pseudomonas quasicaspiana]|nr:hypothetical protein [Pseudomonas quasicaspiana]
MGVIVEFYAVPAGSDDLADMLGTPQSLVGSLSVNSHAMDEFFAALSKTVLVGLVGDGSDVARSQIFLRQGLLSLLTDVGPWAGSGSEMLEDAHIAFDDAIKEVLWAPAICSSS